MMKLFLSILSICTVQFLFAQESSKKKNSENIRITVKGKVTDQGTQKAMAGAVVQLLSVNPNSPDYANDNFFSRTVIAGKDGSFVIDNIPYAEQYNIIVTVIGYTSYNKTLLFDN